VLTALLKLFGIHLHQKKTTDEVFIKWKKKSANCMLLAFWTPGRRFKCSVRDNGARGKERWKAPLYSSRFDNWNVASWQNE
jgi:hypothetical protein